MASERKEEFRTASGTVVKRVYTDQDLSGRRYADDLGDPGGVAVIGGRAERRARDAGGVGIAGDVRQRFVSDGRTPDVAGLGVGADGVRPRYAGVVVSRRPGNA